MISPSVFFADSLAPVLHSAVCSHSCIPPTARHQHRAASGRAATLKPSTALDTGP